ncbi:3-hydroxy-9,10-secoandrosta-1,3,5(10)-triene-9,17-dione monooxygenase oxygenase subunit [Nocardia sp. CA-151230]|uniref:3-hydroxy-9,10-secoandrosta-1,3,5(10)-triene-9, 17-dione monooxygenase oxygenase subunit n=1 Tax=Nocardia sp. CA-151230 TaxID=3239982 RepID=UPI003D8D93CF
MSGTTPMTVAAGGSGDRTGFRFPARSTAGNIDGRSYADVAAAISALTPLVREQAARSDRDRTLNERVITAIVETGLFHLLRPRVDGVAPDLLGFFAGVRALAAASPSIGWVTAMLGTASWHVMLLEPEARHVIWGYSPDVLVSVSNAPAGRLEPVDGGYLLGGEWPNLPAIDHCRWAALAALTIAAEGAPVSLATAVVPCKELVVGDHWNTTGMRGTGSRRVSAHQVFVPASRVRTAPPRDRGTANENPPGRCPLAIVYSLAACMPVVGAVQGAFEDHLERAGRRAAFSLAGARSVIDPAVQAAIARGLGEIDASILQLERNSREAMAVVASGTPVPAELRLRTRRDQVRATERALAALESLMGCAGAEAVREGGSLERTWRDIRTAAAHLVNQAEPALRLYGQWAFGLDVHDDMVMV